VRDPPLVGSDRNDPPTRCWKGPFVAFWDLMSSSAGVAVMLQFTYTPMDGCKDLMSSSSNASLLDNGRSTARQTRAMPLKTAVCSPLRWSLSSSKGPPASTS
ncbi:unnamed protein product, partial [Closterium sp. Naga37s-1]